MNPSVDPEAEVWVWLASWNRTHLTLVHWISPLDLRARLDPQSGRYVTLCRSGPFASTPLWHVSKEAPEECKTCWQAYGSRPPYDQGFFPLGA